MQEPFFVARPTPPGSIEWLAPDGEYRAVRRGTVWALYKKTMGAYMPIGTVQVDSSNPREIWKHHRGFVDLFGRSF
jgi:hypothetical protein